MNIIKFDFKNKSYEADLSEYEETSKGILEDTEKTGYLIQNALQLCDKLSELPYIGKYIAEIPYLCTMTKDYVNGIYKRVPLGTIVAILAAIVYFVSPADFLPDTIPVIGYIDDATVLGTVISSTSNDLNKYKEWKELEAAA